MTVLEQALAGLPLLTYARVRSLSFALQFQVLHGLSRLVPGSQQPNSRAYLDAAVSIERAMRELFERDIANIREGVYPISVLKPEPPLEHLKRIPKIVWDGVSIYRRRARGKTTEFDSTAKDFLDELPRYYRRNFHFQTNGYLSEQSAELYEHQVEMLFGGTADAMRRLIIAPMKAALKKKHAAAVADGGRGLTILEVAAGTGRTSRFVRLAFPKAKIVVTDLSEFYLRLARRKLAEFARVDFLQADGTSLPFQDETFDAVYSVFLFHELPREQRTQVFKESRRVLKTGGFFGCVDSLQQGDVKEFDPLLLSFPQNYHEPFYRDYVAHPLERLIKGAGFKKVGTNFGFFSKVTWSG